MNKPILISTSTIFMALLIMLVPSASPNINIFSNAMAQESGYGYGGGEKDRSYYPTDDYKYECKKGPFKGFYVSSVEFCDAKFPFDDKKKEKPKDRPEPEPVKNPILTVTKEMFICRNADTSDSPPIGGFDRFLISCLVGSEGPNSPVWIPWEDCSEISEVPELVNDNFCTYFDEADFLIQIEQNTEQPNFIRFEFPGNSNGRSVIVESGTFQVTEEVSPVHTQCQNTNYDDRAVQIVHTDTDQPPGLPEGVFCFTLEGDCSGTIQAGEEKACTVKNYLVLGDFAVPQNGNAVNGATTTGTTTTQSNNAITTQSNNTISNPTTTTTQSSNIGSSQSINVLPQSNNAIPNTFSSAPSSLLANMMPSNPP